MRKLKLTKIVAATTMAAVLLVTGCRSNTTNANDTTTTEVTTGTTKETTKETNNSSSSGNSNNDESNNNNNASNNESENNASGSDNTTKVEAEFAESADDMFTDRDSRITYDEKDSIAITLTGDSASCKSNTVDISGSVITIKDEGTYIISGTLNDGRIVVNADDKDKIQLVLKNVNITSATLAPIYVIEADKVFITLAEGSVNTLKNGGTFEAVDENNIDAVIFSKQDLTLNGNGSLTVDSPAGHGITSKDDLVIASGTYIISCASHGLDANDSIRVKEAFLTIDSGKDGIHADNSDDAEKGFVYVYSGTFDIDAEGDGLSASAYMQIEGGEFDIVTGGGSANASQQTSSSWGMGGFGGGSKPGRPGQEQQQQLPSSTATGEDSTSIKALKAANSLLINGGTFTIDSADDAVHSNTDVIINGGTFEIATGDDGFHADENMTITNGKINITKSYEGIEGLDILISGGDITIVAKDDGINAAGGTDESGLGGVRGNDRFGGGFGGMGGMGGGMSSGNGSITISGGTIYMNASGDGIDANGTLLISGGMITVCGPTTGDTSVLDYDKTGTITGGTFIGTGSTMMAQSFSSAKQGVIALNTGNQSAGTTITVKDSKGNEILSYAPKLGFGLFILSTPDMVSGETYTVTIGSQSGTFTAN